MCIAVPGRVITVEEGCGSVDFNGNVVMVSLALVDAKPGDFVLIHAGCAIEILQRDQAEELQDLFQELERELQA